MQYSGVANNDSGVTNNDSGVKSNEATINGCNPTTHIHGIKLPHAVSQREA